MLAIRNFIIGYAVNIKNVVYFFMPSIMGLLITLVTFPIFSKNLSSYDFAVMGYFESINQIFLPIMNLSFYSFYMKDFFKRTDEENRRVRAVLIKFLSFVNIGIVLLGLTLLVLYFNWGKVSFPIYPYGIISLATIYFSIYISFLGIEYRMKKQGLKFFILHSTNIILPIALGLYLVIAMKLGATGRMLGTFLAQLVLGVLAFRLTFIKVKLDFELIKKALTFGFPLILVALLNLPAQNMDRIILERQNDIDSFALYSIGLKVAGIVFAGASAVYQAFEPDFFKHLSNNNKKGFLQIVGVVFGFLLVVNVLFSISAEPIINLLTSGRFSGAYQFSNLIIWSNFFLLFSYLLSIILVVLNKTKFLLYIQIIIAVLGVTLFSLFIEKWQFIGAGYAKILINITNCILLIFFILISLEGGKLLKIFKNKRLKEKRLYGGGD